MDSKPKYKIGVFDSGVGGLTVYKSIKDTLPQYDYIYLGDNGRAPYGNKSFETVYQYTLQCVQWMIKQGAHLIILACNTASARALRTIQMNDWSQHIHNKRILGVIKPTVEYIPQFSVSKHIGVVATEGTVRSNTYPIEFQHIDEHIVVNQKACPLWVPLIEVNQVNALTENIIAHDIHDLLNSDPEIDSLLLGCTHYPHILNTIKKFVPDHIQIYSQGDIVSRALRDYLNKHTWLSEQLSQNGTEKFYTTDTIEPFIEVGLPFLGREMNVEYLNPETFK